MNQNLDDFSNFSNFLSYCFVKLQENSSRLQREIPEKFSHIKDAFLMKKLNLALAQLAQYHKDISLEINRFHDLFILFSQVALKNEDKCFQIQEKLKKINKPDLYQKFETLGNAFGHQVKSQQKLIENIIAQTIHFEDTSPLENFEQSHNDMDFIKILTEHNIELNKKIKDYSELINNFGEFIQKTAEYDIKIQEMYNQVFVTS